MRATETALPRLTEKQWQKQVVDMAKLFGFEVYHPYLSIHSERGWPDLSMVHSTNGRLLFVELKAEHGKTTTHQDKWLALLRTTGAEVYLWRPSDFEEAARILRSRAAKPKENGEDEVEHDRLR